MQPSGTVPQPAPGTTFKNGPAPQPSGHVPGVVSVGGLGNSVVVQTGGADTATKPHAPKPGP